MRSCVFLSLALALSQGSAATQVEISHSGEVAENSQAVLMEALAEVRHKVYEQASKVAQLEQQRSSSLNKLTQLNSQMHAAWHAAYKEGCSCLGYPCSAGDGGCCAIECRR